MSSSASVRRRMFNAVKDRFNRLDVLVTTALIWQAISLDERTAADNRRKHDVNIWEIFHRARRAGLWMVALWMIASLRGRAIITIGDWAIRRRCLNHTVTFFHQQVRSLPPRWASRRRGRRDGW